jgi:hypothetical protein
MSWDKGFNFRGTSLYVTDPSGDTYVLASDAYQVTRNGVTFGWLDTPSGADRQVFSGDAAKVSGIQYGVSGQRFQVDLPSAGTYGVRLALGDAAGAQTQMQVKIKDTTTVLLTIGPHDVSAVQFYDASDTFRATEVAWVSDNVAASLSFATSTLILTLEGPVGVSNTTIAHLHLAFVAPPPSLAMPFITELGGSYVRW